MPWVERMIITSTAQESLSISLGSLAAHLDVLLQVSFKIKSLKSFRTAIDLYTPYPNQGRPNMHTAADIGLGKKRTLFCFLGFHLLESLYCIVLSGKEQIYKEYCSFLYNPSLLTNSSFLPLPKPSLHLIIFWLESIFPVFIWITSFHTWTESMSKA